MVTFDKTALESAQLRLDAERGKLLMAALEMKWWNEGNAAFAAGLPLDDLSLWSDEHRQGWQDAYTCDVFNALVEGVEEMTPDEYDAYEQGVMIYRDGATNPDTLQGFTLFGYLEAQAIYEADYAEMREIGQC